MEGKPFKESEAAEDMVKISKCLPPIYMQNAAKIEHLLFVIHNEIDI